jgi:divalent metal cation (Fe/Co/Zn/Cd) transporter
MMVHNYGPNHYIASFHAEVDGSKDIFILHDEIDNLEKEINTELGILCTVHMDPIVTNDETVNELREFVNSTIKAKYPEISTHDFRVVIGNTHTNLIFDIVVPFDVKHDVKAICEDIKQLIHSARPDHFCVITVDRE